MDGGFCKDCLFFRLGFFKRIFGFYDDARCTHPTAQVSDSTPNPVSGRVPKLKYRKCDTMRDGYCKGRSFVKREEILTVKKQRKIWEVLFALDRKEIK